MEVQHNLKVNAYLLRSALVGALGGLLFGFDTAVIAGTTHSLTRVFSLTPASLGLTVSIALWGTVFGAMTSGMLGSRLGGRSAMRVMALFYLLSAIGCGLAWSWPSLLVFRFIGGIGVGGSSVLAPVYIAELAPAKWRGRLVGMFQVNVVLGIVVAYVSNFLITTWHLGALEWRVQFSIAGIPAAIFAALLFMVPNSSRWLAAEGRTEEARKVLVLFGSLNPDPELKEIVASMHQRTEPKHDSVFKRKYLFPVLLALTIGAFNQLAGINAILYYLNDIFAAAGFSQVSSSAMAIAVGMTNFLSTLVGMTLIDSVGRKTLLLVGAVGMIFSLLGVADIFHTGHGSAFLLYLLIAFIFFFSISQGAVIWVYISEIFPTKVRSQGQAIGSSAHWIMNAIVAGLFPLAAAKSRAVPFVFFAAMMALQFLLVSLFFPETKGKTLEQIQSSLVKE
jgi:SP family arabinose:H+ symporter-like MFS transporter